MFSRIRVASAIALLISILLSATASAKGGFNFIAITGPGLQEEIRVTDAELTQDFFAFANFYEDKTKAPTDPGAGYEIFRYYVDGKREIAFDRLHYYPETGFVFYDGIENGESEYDGDWYIAKPDIKAVFESALEIQAGTAGLEKKEAISSVSQPESENSAIQSQPGIAGLQSLPIMMIVIATALAILIAFAFGRRKPSIHN